MEYKIYISWDDEAGCWVGYNDDIPLAFDAETMEELMKKIRDAAPEIIELNHLPQAKILHFIAEKQEEVFA